MEDWGEWVKNIEKLRKNAEKCGLAALKRDYAKAYKNLTEKIAKQTQEVCIDFLTGGMCVLGGSEREFQTCLKRINLILSQEKEALKEVSRVVFLDYDPGRALDVLAEKIWPRIWLQAYGPYWVSCCRNDGWRIVCDLLPGYEWDETSRLWVKTSEDGWMSFTIMLPPTMKLLEEEYRKWQSGG